MEKADKDAAEKLKKLDLSTASLDELEKEVEKVEGDLDTLVDKIEADSEVVIRDEEDKQAAEEALAEVLRLKEQSELEILEGERLADEANKAADEAA